MIHDDPRIHRVALLRADEAEQLGRDARNELFKCCPHLGVFHVRGRSVNGGRWRACNVASCECYEAEPPDARSLELAAAAADAVARERRKALLVCLVAGILVGVVVGWLLRAALALDPHAGHRAVECAHADR